MLSLSIDDGNPLDLKLADVLDKNGLKATFYIPIKKPRGKVLTKKQIRMLAQGFEIGAHTYNHVDLTTVDHKEALTELVEGKMALEDILGKRVKAFAFPFGHYTGKLVELVKRAGYENCRSGRIINFIPFDDNEFVQHPNLQIYPHKLTTDLRHCLKYGDIFSFTKRLFLGGYKHIELYRLMPRNSPIHFWCHSQDMQKFDLWNFFDKLGKDISQFKQEHRRVKHGVKDIKDSNAS